MSSIIKFDLKELRKLINDKNSCVLERKVAQNLALQPWCLGNVKESIKNLLDYKIGKYDKEFNGILLSYQNLRILHNIGTIRNDNADIHFQIQADHFIFQPYVGATLTGIVNKKSVTHLSILVHRVFNVVIPRPTEEPGNKWVGTSVQEGQEVSFKIVVLDLVGALPYIRGELDERCCILGADGDDDDIETKPLTHMNVSYVDFDKTKPNIKKQIGDAQNISLNNSTNDECNRNELDCNQDISTKSPSMSNGKHNMSITKKVASGISMAEKRKKRQSKFSEGETKQSETNSKPSKKHKRDS